MNKKIVAVTACAAGIAHTYMAAESLEKVKRKKAGYKIKVETQGSIGAENVLTEKDIETADVVNSRIYKYRFNVDFQVREYYQ